jgi:hypothetical protein
LVVGEVARLAVGALAVGLTRVASVDAVGRSEVDVGDAASTGATADGRCGGIVAGGVVDAGAASGPTTWAGSRSSAGDVVAFDDAPLDA